MSESVARRRIRRAIEAKGLQIATMEWSPIHQIGNSYEDFSWNEGGWTVFTDGPVIVGENVAQVLEFVSYLEWA